MNLFFDTGKREALNNIITRVLDTRESPEGEKQMIWRKTNAKKKPVYTVGLAERKLKIKIYRKHMATDTYATLNELGREILEEINK